MCAFAVTAVITVIKNSHLYVSVAVLMLVIQYTSWYHNLETVGHHHHVPEGLGILACSLILKMKLVPPSLPRSSYVPLSFWFIM